VSVVVSAATTTVDPANTVTLTATVTNDKNSAGVTWAQSGVDEEVVKRKLRQYSSFFAI
jgi:hypothetical protein